MRKRRLIVALFGAVVLLDAPLAGAAPHPLPQQAGDAVPDAATQRAVLAASYGYFADKDAGRYPAAYGRFAASVRAYLTPGLYATEAANFNAAAGKVGERRIVVLDWAQDPPEAPAPGLYVSADFVARFANLRLHCGYLMWHREADGVFRIVREEQSFLDEQAASAMTPERLRTLPRKFGCPGAAD
ncbi:DUF4019 domain-containing protein [Sphingomonas solaris]|uniref:DUF4019 domain-containing protein n=1 Tax=Alterirhizorhabdus solaris TaxID=2529389 RepID=A0A558QSR6_9SPHN|nr:DUF4019 domain-containing protein [Sphingomonas solaris]TVV70112.1 DUF4019 domain-containing protein [Sphingomonas solaris]